MKNFRSLLLFLFIPFFGLTQSLNGVYTGVLSNDSNTIRKDQSFEMALTEYNGKVYGYAYSTFIVNDTLYYIVKRVKGKVEGDICEVEDDEVLSHNFPQKPEKKVFVTYTLQRGASDSIWRLDGNWKTNLVQKRKYGYYSISGKVETKEEKDLSKSKLYEHLGDLDLQKTLAFSKPKETAPEKKSAKGKEDKNNIAKNTGKKDGKKDVVKTDTKPVENKPDASIAKVETKTPDAKTTSASVNNQPTQTEKKDAIASNTNVTDKKPAVPVAKTESKLPDNKTQSNPITNPPTPNEKKNELVTNSVPVDKKPETAVVKPETKLPDHKPAVATTNNQPDKTEKKDVIANTNNVEKKPEANIAKTETKLPDNKPVPAPVKNEPSQNVKKDVVTTNTNNTNAVKQETKQPDSKLVSVPVRYQPSQQNAKKDVAVTTTIDKKPETSIAKQETKVPDAKTTPTSTTNTPVNQNEKKDVVSLQKKPDADFEFQEISRVRANRTLRPAAALVDGRETNPSETILFRSDSLSIALYDNGEVDGDTVSVIINDVMFIEKQGLRSAAFRKTFYIPPGESDSLLVVLYADNLGKYPPNTGLLQIKDGEEIFYVRFKADLDQNAAILLRRKNK